MRHEKMWQINRRLMKNTEIPHHVAQKDVADKSEVDEEHGDPSLRSG
jgi:hypothetical protein